MGKVYKHAVATIIAAASTAAADGFLWSQVKAKPCSEKIITTPDGTSGTIYVEPLTAEALDHLPLSSRAWCFQEYMLSSRHLVYNERELVWQYRSLPHATVTVGSVEYSSQRVRSAVFGIFHTEGTIPAPDTDDRKKKSQWQEVVRNYTRRALTDSRDRLNAITGVANEFSELWQDECMFGSWRSRFVEELAWSVTAGIDDSAHHRLEFAPTWSWASMHPSVQITPGWLDEVADTTLIFLSDCHREATIMGTVLTSDQIPIATTVGFYDNSQDWGCMDTDLLECDVLPQILFLLLGSDDGDMHALVLNPAGAGLYQRIGLGVFDKPDELESPWLKAKKKEIVLV
jgi:hypothetical protein